LFNFLFLKGAEVMDQRSISMAKNKEQLFDALKQNYKNANKQDSERSF